MIHEHEHELGYHEREHEAEQETAPGPEAGSRPASAPETQEAQQPPLAAGASSHEEEAVSSESAENYRVPAASAPEEASSQPKPPLGNKTPASWPPQDPRASAPFSPQAPAPMQQPWGAPQAPYAPPGGSSAGPGGPPIPPPPYSYEYPAYPQGPNYSAGSPWGNQPYQPPQGTGGQGAWPPPPGYRWDSGFSGAQGIPRGSKRGGKAFGALFISIGVVLLVALIAAMITVSGRYELPTAPSQSSPLVSEPPASQPEESLPGGENGDSSLPEKEKPSAVPEASFTGITIEGKRQDPISAKEIYKRVVESVVGVNTTVKAGDTTALSEGSGIVLTEDGLILTNAHVLDYSRDNEVSVVLHDGTEYAASVIGFDKYSDLAVLRIDAQNLDPAEFGDVSLLEVGDEVFAIGNPGGMSYASSLTGGYISALNRSLKNSAMTFIQTDAAINPGNSGGALVNDCGQVIGINSNKIVSTSYEGMGFAIPISQVKDIIDNLVTKGYVEGRGRLGVTILSDGTGLQIQSIEEGSGLYGKAEKGDYILAADDVELSSMDDLYLVLAGHSAGESVKLKIFDVSENVTFQVSVQLLEDKGETQSTISPEP